MYRAFSKKPLTRSINWNEYLTKIIEISRQSYEVERVKNLVKDRFFDSSFLPPCQVEVLDSGREVIWLLVHDTKRKDKEFEIHHNVKNYGESEFARTYKLKTLPETFLESKPSNVAQLWIFTKQRTFSGLSGDPEDVADQILETLMTWARYELREDQVNAIRRSTSGLRESASRLEQKEMRDYVEKFAKKIDRALEEIKRIDEHEKKLVSVEKDIVGVRRLVGVSQEFQDWRTLASDVTALKKKPLVSQGIFTSEIKRLDQRIDALTEIRFWSKRTIVDVVLAAVATASTIIAALLAAGIIPPV
jgi:hypothetical protein